ncbi:MAG: ABC-F family ATP-binding cassette domain-containing protein [Firmicutes bacterium]|nr:ABC-F family ATP-binding cassette domain-containing protein [Bacillota bacterium]
MQINVSNISVEYDGTPVIYQADFVIHENEKIALIGRNGCGKTTLLKVLTGEVEYQKGEDDAPYGIFTSGNPVIGFLKQTSNDDKAKTMFDEILDAYSSLIKIEKDMESALEDLQNDSCDQNVRRYSRLCEQFEREGGYTYKKEYLTAVKKFGFSNEDMQKPLCEFSGGQRTKISLLKLLLSKPDVLLLDEPTNHLDLEAIEWLENYLCAYKKSCVIVSHDRMFLDKIVNVVYEIEYGETKRYQGNYTSFTAQKQQAYDKALKDSIMRKKEIDRLSALVERFRYKAKKAAMAQAKLKQIERIGEVGTPSNFDTATFKSNFQPERETVEKAVVLDKLVFGYDKPLGQINTIIKRGDKVGIIGQNGCGKSTLVKTIVHKIKALDGSATFGLHAQVGYFDQTSTQSFSTLTVLEDFQNEFPMLSNTEARSALGAFMLSGDDVFKRICDLSGGEKVRLALCKILRKKPNILILDEPTNHMDIIGKETLERLLSNYTGTVITVSHDRYFVNRVCNRLIVFDGGKVELFDGKYSDYESRKQVSDFTNDFVKTVDEKKKEKPVSQSKEAARRAHRISFLEEKMNALNEQISSLQNTMHNDQSVYSDYTKIAEIEEQISSLQAKLAPLEEEWLELSEKQ